MFSFFFPHRFALDVLLNYFTYTDLSPLKKTFINVAKPLATSVGFSQNSNWESAVSAAFKNVPVDRIEEVKPLFDKVLTDIWTGGAKSLDMDRLATISKSAAKRLFSYKRRYIFRFGKLIYHSQKICQMAQSLEFFQTFNIVYTLI